jgi:hypothetical protein
MVVSALRSEVVSERLTNQSFVRFLSDVSIVSEHLHFTQCLIQFLLTMYPSFLQALSTRISPAQPGLELLDALRERCFVGDEERNRLLLSTDETIIEVRRRR